MKTEVKALVCVSGIYVCYITYGIVQEWLFRFRSPVDGSQFQFTLSLLFIQCFANALFGGLASLTYEQPKHVPVSAFSITGATYMGAMLCSNDALKYVNYPTQTLAKSCKMIPVMLMGVLLRGKRYSLREYATVMMITAGISVFRLSNKSDLMEGNSSYGLTLLFISLLLDGVTGPQQEKLKSAYAPSPHQFMAYTNLWAMVFLSGALAYTGEAAGAVSYITANPQVLTYIVLFALTSAAGQNFIFYSIHTFDPLVCSLITTTRKFFTLLASVMLFGNSLSTPQWFGVLLVFSALSVDLYAKYNRRGRGGGVPVLDHQRTATAAAAAVTKKDSKKER